MLSEYTDTLLNTVESALIEDQLIFDNYAKNARSTWLLSMSKLIADLTFAEQLRHRVNAEVEPLKTIDFSLKETEGYERVMEQQRRILEKLADFIERTNQQWIDSFTEQDLLHLHEPLLRKQGQYYLVNAKPEVSNAHAPRPDSSVRRCHIPARHCLARSHASLPNAELQSITASGNILSTYQPLPAAIRRSR